MTIKTTLPKSFTDSPWFFRVAFWVVGVGVLTLLGPFTHYAMLSDVGRLFYWAGLVAMAMVIGYTVRLVIRRVVVRETGYSDLAVALVQTAILGPMIWAVNAFCMGFNVRNTGSAIHHVGVVLALCLCLVLVRMYLRVTTEAMRTDAQDAPSQAAPPQEPPFLHRLEPELSGPVLRVSADNHYLDVYTAEGKGRLNMRFRDALDQLQSAGGVRIHRSHWVAEQTLVAVHQDGRRHVAELTCGTRLPVSNAYVDEVRPIRSER